MSQKRDPLAGSAPREGQFAKGEGKSPELCLEIGVGSRPARGALGEEEVGSADVPLCGLGFGVSGLKHFQEAGTLYVICGQNRLSCHGLSSEAAPVKNVELSTERAGFLLLLPFCPCSLRSISLGWYHFLEMLRSSARVQDGSFCEASSITPCAFHHFLVVFV